MSARWLSCVVLPFLLGADCGMSEPEGTPCATTADCCYEGPSSLCSAGTCQANQFCAADPSCFGSRWGACDGQPQAICGDGYCQGNEQATCPSDCTSSPGEACSELPQRSWQGTQACYPIGPTGEFVVDELVTLWNTQPVAICAYEPNQGAANACGPLPPNNAVYCGYDNTISWDIQFMGQHYQQFGDFAPVLIAAHEWGHRNQAATGLTNGGRSVFQNEQHADCQAGIFAAVSERRGFLQMGDVMEAFASLCSLGGTSGWFDPTSHGTCQERIAAFQHGYIYGKQYSQQVCSSGSIQAMLQICAN